MKIGIISDIHGNHYALDQVLKYANKLKVDHFLVLGDLIGYFHQPELVINKLKNIPCTVIQGNHERILKKILYDEIGLKTVTEKYGPGHEKAIKNLSNADLEWLINLPKEQELVIDTIKIKLCHGSPLGPDDYIYPDTSKEYLNQLLFCDNDFIFIGHTHYQFQYHHLNKSLINVGSVGQSREFGGLANWGVLDTENRVYISQRTPYKVSNLLKDIKCYPSNIDYLSSVITRGWG